MSNRVEHRSAAFILSAVNYRDADRILTFLTEDAGLISAIARGARSSRKRFAGVLQPFSEVQIEWSKGKSLSTLKSAKLSRYWAKIATRPDMMQKAMVIGELIKTLAAEEEDASAFFDAIKQIYDAIEADDWHVPAQLVSIFHLVEVAGMAPNFHSCVISGAAAPSGRAAYFDASRGGIVSRAHSRGGRLLRGSLRQILVDRRFDELSEEEANEALSFFVDYLRAQLNERLGDHLASAFS